MKNRFLTLVLAVISSIQLFAQSNDSTSNSLEINHAGYVSPFYLVLGGLHVDYELILQKQHGFMIGGTLFSGETNAEYYTDYRLDSLTDSYEGMGLNFTYKYYFTPIDRRGTSFYGFLKYSYDNLTFDTPYYKVVRYYDKDFEAVLITEAFDENAKLTLQRHAYAFGVGFLVFTNKNFLFDIETGFQKRYVYYSGDAVGARTYTRHIFDWGSEELIPLVKARFGILF